MSTTSFQSPAPILRSKQKKKRRPTRTPKPTTSGGSRLCSPSPFLDRSSFKRKRLLFSSYHNTKPTSESSSSSSSSSSTDYDDSSDSEYDINQDLNDQYDDEEEERNEEQKEIQKYTKSTTKTTKSHDLIYDIENLSLNSNQTLLRNARSSIRTNKVQTPAKYKQKPPKSKAKPISGENERKKTKPTTNMVRITKSKRVFSKCHVFGGVLVPPLECGSGCPLYRSKWKNEATVTKLMPLYENEEFTKEENVDNALREYELHADMYRTCVKSYGVEQCPVVGIYGCVTLSHSDHKQYLAFVMPALHCNLSQFVTRYRKLSNTEAHMFLRCGLRFLKTLKSVNMIHNDIKPENVFVDVGFDDDNNVIINKFVFGDFGCAALTTEEFPFGSLTGTVTMWDYEALGKKHGAEDGFAYENDLYGFIGCLLDGVYGGSILEELLEEENGHWEETEWDEYTDLVRKCRLKMNTMKFMCEELKHIKCNDKILCIVLMQIAEKRTTRMTLEQMLHLVEC